MKIQFVLFSIFYKRLNFEFLHFEIFEQSFKKIALNGVSYIIVFENYYT